MIPYGLIYRCPHSICSHPTRVMSPFIPLSPDVVDRCLEKKIGKNGVEVGKAIGLKMIESQVSIRINTRT